MMEQVPQPVKRSSVPVPMSPEDFARPRRRAIQAAIAGAAVLALLGFWIYKRATDPIRAQQSYEVGAKMFKDGLYTQAILSFDHAIALKPGLADAYSLRGRAHVAQGDPDPGIADFSRVIQLRPK